MLSWEFPPKMVGGLAQHVYELSRSLVAARGCRVDIITAGEDGYPEMEFMDGIRVHRVLPYHGGKGRDFIDWVQRFNFALLEKGASLFNENGGYDLIHAHDWLVAYGARALKHIYTTPLLATIHATEHGRNNGLHNPEQRSISDIEWWMIYEAWKVICCSGYMKEELMHVFQVPEDKLAVIPNGIRPDAYKPGGKVVLDKSFYDPHVKIVFYIGRLVQEKGVQILLDAAPTIIERFPEAKVLIAGTGPYAEHLKNKTREMGLESKVHFLGYVDDATRNELYNCASVAVFPSLYEPFGIVALEAMVSGTPVVVSSVGGMDGIVEHEVDGLKFYPGNPRSLSDQICRLLENEELAELLAGKAARKAVSQYSWDSIAQQTSKVYEEIIVSDENRRWRHKLKKQAMPDEMMVERKAGKGDRVPHLI
jgi:glycogen(starch) synthase